MWMGQLLLWFISFSASYFIKRLWNILYDNAPPRSLKAGFLSAKAVAPYLHEEALLWWRCVMVKTVIWHTPASEFFHLERLWCLMWCQLCWSSLYPSESPAGDSAVSLTWNPRRETMVTFTESKQLKSRQVLCRPWADPHDLRIPTISESPLI